VESPHVWKLLYSLFKIIFFCVREGFAVPQAVKEVEIPKKDGGIRKLGIPTILDRIAQQVVKTHLEPIVEPLFHESSYAYRPNRNCHQAIKQADNNCNWHDWVIDLDIKGFFDNIDQELLMKGVEHYCKDKWILLYIKRWLQAGIIQKDGTKLDRLTGTPQGGVISPLLANIYLHIVFDKWMDKNHHEKPFERYADDIIVHCRTENQAIFVLNKIRERMTECKLTLHPVKTKIINLRRIENNKYPHKFDFLGYTFKPIWAKTKKGFRLLVAPVMSTKSKSSVLEKIRNLKIHKMRCKIEVLAEKLNPILQGSISYYCKFMANSTHYLWYLLNLRIKKWINWQKGLCLTDAITYLRTKYKEKPNLFAHWKLVHP